MKIILISLFLATLATSISAFRIPGECGHTIVTCPCGRESKQEIEVPIKLCRILSYEHFPPRSYCSPCTKIDPNRICRRFFSCRDCVSNRRSRCSSQDPSKIKRMYCPRPLMLYDGEIRASKETAPGGKMHYKCHHKYRLEGEKTRTCLSDLRWSGKPSRCVRDILCGTPKMPTNGNIGDQSNKNSFNYNDTVTYQCEKDSFLIGSARRTCMSDGNWSGSMPYCVSVMSCQDPGTPKDATRVDKRPNQSLLKNTHFPIGSTLTYKCADGYKLYGSTVQKCVAGNKWVGRQPACVVECGKIFRSKALAIIGGGRLSREMLPWMAGISVDYSPGRTDINCGGSLINERWVVTAAHCVTVRSTTDTYTLNSISVYLGKVNRTDKRDDPIVQKFQAAEVYVHKDYEPRKALNDIALIQLSEDAVINKFVRPICLPPRQESLKKHFRSGVKGRVSGWGNTEEKVKSQVLLTAKVSVFDDNDCLHKVLKPERNYTRGDLKSAFCAGTKDVLYDRKTYHVSDAARFDSGGGLTFESCNADDPTWFLEGIVSWGIPRKPGIGVYVRVSTFTDWIKSII